MVLENSLESLLDCKIRPVHPKGNQPWICTGRTDAEVETPILWPHDAYSWLTGKYPYCWERLRARGEGDNSRWEGWMASQNEWTWVCANSGRYWRTGKPGMLQSMASQRVRHDWVSNNGRFKKQVYQLISFWPLEKLPESKYSLENKEKSCFPRVGKKRQINVLRHNRWEKQIHKCYQFSYTSLAWACFITIIDLLISFLLSQPLSIQSTYSQRFIYKVLCVSELKEGLYAAHINLGNKTK